MANRGAFVPTTNIWDVSELYTIDLSSPQFRELLVRLYQNINAMALVLNIKDSGYYVQDEFINGQQFFPNPSLTSASSTTPVFRSVVRKVINFGALSNTAAKSVAHGLTINSSYTFTRIYGCSSDTSGSNYIPLPYASPTAANNIELKVDSTNVTVITGSDRTNFTTTYIILEYLTT